MKSKYREENSDELCAHYDLSSLLKDGEQGKYAHRYLEGTNLMLLADDVVKAFPTESSVNDALRLVIQLKNLAVANCSENSRQ